MASIGLKFRSINLSRNLIKANLRKLLRIFWKSYVHFSLQLKAYNALCILNDIDGLKMDC